MAPSAGCSSLRLANQIPFVVSQPSVVVLVVGHSTAAAQAARALLPLLPAAPPAGLNCAAYLAAKALASAIWRLLVSTS